MKLASLAFAAAGLFAAGGAHAELVNLTFDDIATNNTVISDYWFGTFSNSVVFSNDANTNNAMIVNASLDPAANSVLSGGGYFGALAFSYFNVAGVNGTVNVLDANGATLASFDLADNSGVADSQTLSTWTTISKPFEGVASSIVFEGLGGNIAFDNVSVSAVPLPAAALLFPLGIAAMGLGRRKRQAAV